MLHNQKEGYMWEEFIKEMTTMKLFLITATVASLACAEEKQSIKEEIQPMIVHQFFEEAKKNNNWKAAFVTGEQEQIVFMNVSPITNPKNEIGKEIHQFDQVIIIVEGTGQAIIDGKTSSIKEGSMIFIPKGTEHNVINLDQKKGLKLISFYSETDIPKNAIYKKKTDQPED